MLGAGEGEQRGEFNTEVDDSMHVYDHCKTFSHFISLIEESYLIAGRSIVHKAS